MPTLNVYTADGPAAPETAKKAFLSAVMKPWAVASLTVVRRPLASIWNVSKPGGGNAPGGEDAS
jgi:hypothetical protein